MRYKLAVLLERTHGIGRKNYDARKTDILGNRTLGNLLLRNAAAYTEFGVVTKPVRHHYQNSCKQRHIFSG